MSATCVARPAGARASEKPTCGKSFTRLSRLREHQSVYSSERPFTCSDCSKGFKSSKHLKVHRCLRTGKRPYTCRDCGKYFNQPQSLLVHQRTNTGERPYTCAQCSKDFTHSSRLLEHQCQHTEEWPYTYALCGKGFTRSSRLLSHKWVNAGNRLVVCKSVPSAHNTHTSATESSPSHWPAILELVERWNIALGDQPSRVMLGP